MYKDDRTQAECNAQGSNLRKTIDLRMTLLITATKGEQLHVKIAAQTCSSSLLEKEQNGQ